MNGVTAKKPDEVKIVLNELITRVQPIFGEKLKRVILFGSYARGDYDSESDIDIMFILDEDDESIKKYNNVLTRIEVDIDLKYNVILSSIMQNEAKFHKYLNVLPFYTNVQSEGVTLYEQ